MKLGFACPYYGPTPPRVTTSQIGAVQHVAWQHPWGGTYTTERMPHVKACEQILARALANPTIDALFWTEHDCVLPMDAVTRLVRLLEERPEADMATGITFMRHRPYHPMIAHYAGKMTREQYEEASKIAGVTGVRESDIGKDHFRFVTRIDTSEAPYAVDATSMNCLLLRRRVLEMLAEIPGPFDCEGVTTPDFAMCARLMGKAKLLVDPALLTLHLGEPEAVGFDRWVEEMEALVDRGDATRE